MKKCNFDDFISSLNTYKKYDLMMCKLGCIESNTLQKEVDEIEKEENEVQQRNIEARKIKRPSNPYDNDTNI